MQVASGDVTVSITGVEATSAVGTVTPFQPAIFVDMHDGRNPRKKKYRVKEDADDISRIVNEAIYGKAVKDPVIAVPVVPAIAAKPVDDDEESILLLML
jgi:hypothetical protein